MRVFACSLLSSAAQSACARDIAMLVSRSAGLLRSIPADTAHITYAFAADVADERVAGVVRAVERIARRHDGVAVRLGVPFVLYGGSKARLVCAPVTHGADAVAAIGEDCVRTLAPVLGDGAVTGSRSQHVTLARFRKGTRRREAKIVAEMAARLAPIDDHVGRLQLMVSRLTPAGPVYAPLVDAALGVSAEPPTPRCAAS
jgi:2'-5' RNA ligase